MQNVDETGNRESEMLVNSVGSASTTKDGDTCALGNFTILQLSLVSTSDDTLQSTTYSLLMQWLMPIGLRPVYFHRSLGRRCRRIIPTLPFPPRCTNPPMQTLVISQTVDG